MSGTKNAGLVILLGTLMGACFREPVAKPAGLDLDRGLLGQWVCSPLGNSIPSGAKLTVLRFDAGDYLAELREIDGDGPKEDDVARYRAYPTKLNGVTFLSLEDLDPGPEQSDWRWSAVRYAIAPDGLLTLQVPSKRILDLTEDTALQIFRREITRPDAWQQYTQCHRLK